MSNDEIPKGKKMFHRQSVSMGSLQSVSEFVERISQRMRELGFNQSTLANAMGVERKTLYSIMQMGFPGEATMPRIPTLIKLAYALKVHPFWLLEGLFHNVHIPQELHCLHDGIRGAVLEDLSQADGALVAPSTRFTKTWLVQNIGDKPILGHTLVCIDEEVEVRCKQTGEVLHAAYSLRPDQREIPIQDNHPGDVFEVSVDFTAPPHAGTVVSYWLLRDSDGKFAFEGNKSAAIWARVNVTTLGDTVAYGEPGAC